jgi:hypothetical protein
VTQVMASSLGGKTHDDPLQPAQPRLVSIAPSDGHQMTWCRIEQLSDAAITRVMASSLGGATHDDPLQPAQHRFMPCTPDDLVQRTKVSSDTVFRHLRYTSIYGAPYAGAALAFVPEIVYHHHSISIHTVLHTQADIWCYIHSLAFVLEVVELLGHLFPRLADIQLLALQHRRIILGKGGGRVHSITS